MVPKLIHTGFAVAANRGCRSKERETEFTAKGEAISGRAEARMGCLTGKRMKWDGSNGGLEGREDVVRVEERGLGDETVSVMTTVEFGLKTPGG